MPRTQVSIWLSENHSHIKKGMRVNHKTVQRIMQKNQWQCRVKVKKRKKDGQPYAVAENILDRNFQSERPLEKLVTDITYLPYGQKQLYLSSILDLYNGEVIALQLAIDRTQTLSYTHLISCPHCQRTACYIVTKVLFIHLMSIRKLLKQKALP